MLRTRSGSFLSRPIDDESIPAKPHKKIGRVTLLKRIGSGSFGSVFLGLDRSIGTRYAVKRVNFRDVCKQYGGVGQLEREIRLLRNFSHRNILKLYEVYKARAKPYAYLIMEFADCGSLDERVDGSPPCYSVPDILSIIKQTVCALNYMHSKSIVHKDVKPSNILLCSDGRVLLADFGVGHRFQSAAMVVGSPAYQAPECLDYTEDEEDESDAIHDDGPIKEDVWMLGVTFYQLLFNRLPFVGESLYEILNVIRTKELYIPETCDPNCAQLIRRMLAVDPKDRISMKEIAECPIIRDASDFVAHTVPVKYEETQDLDNTVEVEVSIVKENEKIYTPNLVSLPAVFHFDNDAADENKPMMINRTVSFS